MAKVDIPTISVVKGNITKNSTYDDEDDIPLRERIAKRLSDPNAIRRTFFLFLKHPTEFTRELKTELLEKGYTVLIEGSFLYVNIRVSSEENASENVWPMIWNTPFFLTYVFWGVLSQLFLIFLISYKPYTHTCDAATFGYIICVYVLCFIIVFLFQAWKFWIHVPEDIREEIRRSKKKE